jgi:MoaA/NifB/PqqE/SkfB family radical SAM enzyme
MDLSGAVDSVKFGLEFFVLRRDRPYILGLALTDICNLHCRHCRVANIYRSSMTIGEIEGHLRQYHGRGARFLYLEGGEPYLWRDGKHRLADVVQLARQIGYLRVHIYTNGTRPLDANADFTWVSIDGLGDVFRALRGIPLDRVLENVRDLDQRFAFIFVVNTVNRRQIHEFLNFVEAEFPRRKVMFFLHTPYYGFDELFLSSEQRREAIETLLHCKKSGLPVFNSHAGLKALQTGRYSHPTRLWWVVDKTGEYQCCRALGNPEVCENCGYSSCAEIVLSRSFHPGPLWTMLKCY